MILVLAFVGCPRDGPDAELACTAREAVELARDAQADDRSAVLWPGRFRLLALIVGVCAPILAAAYIWRASSQSELDPTEVIEAVEKYVLPDSTLPPDRSLPSPPKHDSQTALSNQSAASSHPAD